MNRQLERDQTRIEQKGNGDEDRYEKRWACYTKVLPHNEQGEVDPAALYNARAQRGVEDVSREPPLTLTLSPRR
jgi:hypothetical protein